MTRPSPQVITIIVVAVLAALVLVVGAVTFSLAPNESRPSGNSGRLTRSEMMSALARPRVISLATREDRRRQFRDGPEARWSMTPRFLMGVALPRHPELGCLRSHIQALSAGIAAKEDPFVVMEDDFEARVDLDTLRRRLDEIDQETAGKWGGILLARVLHAGRRRGGHVVEVRRTKTTAGYLVRAKEAARLHKYLTKLEGRVVAGKEALRLNAMDVHWNDVVGRRGAWFTTSHPLGGQRPGYSDITHREEDYTAYEKGVRGAVKD